MLYGFNGFVLDLARGCLRAGDHDIELRPKSFEILRYLVENAGRLVGKEELFVAVWGQAVVTDESLARCISDARAAIGDRDQTIIRTARRRGYLFCASVTRHEGPFLHGALATASDLPQQSLHDRPAIAVLAFANMSGDPNQEYFSDGITEDIITELSRFGEVAVIARNSSFRYKGKAVDIRQIGHELNVQYILEGSVRRVGNRVRITAQLVDANTAAHRWAERYDRDLNDILDVQDEVARTVATVLAAHVTNAEEKLALNKPPATWKAYDYYLRAAATLSAFLSSYQAEKLFEARRLAEASVALDPDYPRPYAVLSSIHVIAWLHPFDESAFKRTTLEKARQLAARAVQLGPNLPQAHAHLGNAMSWQHDHERALFQFGKAIALNPNFADFRHALALVHASEPRKALEVGNAYLARDPFAPASASVWLGAAHYLRKEYAQAKTLLREATERMPHARFAHNFLAATYAQIGELGLARAAVEQVLRIDPTYTIEGRARVIFAFRSPDDTEHLVDGMRKAGVPER